MVRVGQGLYGRIKFVDGTMPEYDRTYLVVSVSPESIGILNVSSAIGKAAKLLFTTNKYIKKHFPPFPKKSFVKLDSLVYVSVSEVSSMHILANGDILDQAEMGSILKAIGI